MDNWELSECVVVNIKNIAVMTPSIVAHPMYQIALAQAEELAGQLNPMKAPAEPKEGGNGR